MIESSKDKATKRYRLTNKHKETAKTYHSSEHGKRIVLRSRLKTKFGISLEEYEAIQLKHNHRCAICSIDEKVLTKKLCLDHCHTTGKIRGLLCDACNKGIGHFKDNPIILQQAITDLRNNT